MDMAHLANVMTMMIALILSLSFHEASHAYAAKWQGDLTAKMAGRLTLNPLPHIDPLGTLILPALMMLSGMNIMFGWAKPVPVNTNNLRNKKWGDILVSLAGPLSNLVICLVCIILIAIYNRTLTGVIPQGHFLYPVMILIQQMVFLNAILAVFNLIPLAPLDGGSIFPPLLPRGAKEFYDDYIAPYGSFILIALLFVQPFLMGLQTAALIYVNLAQMFVGFVL